MMEPSSAGTVLGRHLRVLDAFDVLHPFRTLSEIAAVTGLPVSTAHRLVNALAREGLLERQSDRTYRLGVRLWEYAARTPGAVGLREVARPWVNAVQGHVRQHTQLGILADTDVLFLERLSARDAVVNATLIGGRIPLALSSSGLVLLAHADDGLLDRVIAAGWPRHTAHTLRDGADLRARLRRVRADGFAVLDGHIHEQSRGVAVPVPGPHGEVYAALGVVVPNDAVAPHGLIDLLRQAAAGITRDLRNAYRPDAGASRDIEMHPLLSPSQRSLEYFAARGTTDLGR